MIKKLKNFFTSGHVIKSEVKNQELIEKISDIIYMSNLNDILFSPSSKLYILNVYNDSFDDFLNNILINNSRDIIAVNINSYFKNKDNIQYTLKRIIPLLEKSDLNIKVQYELNEIIEAINFLKSLEEK